jgi:hypothetical protein
VLKGKATSWLGLTCRVAPAKIALIVDGNRNASHQIGQHKQFIIARKLS